MKTPEQIKAWLEARPWYEQFKNNVMRDWSSTSKGMKRTLFHNEILSLVNNNIPTIRKLCVNG